jgi:hypothetical protein
MFKLRMLTPSHRPRQDVTLGGVRGQTLYLQGQHDGRRRNERLAVARLVPYGRMHLFRMYASRPLRGFDFRSSDDVRFKLVVLDAYYERGSFASKKAALEEKGLTVSDEQTICYDDVVVATERIGCRVGL